jgi:hypothetical protein
VVDGLGTDQVCPIAENQRLVVDAFLFAGDMEFVRVFHPASRLWEHLLVKADAPFVDAGRWGVLASCGPVKHVPISIFDVSHAYCIYQHVFGKLSLRFRLPFSLPPPLSTLSIPLAVVV